MTNDLKYFKKSVGFPKNKSKIIPTDDKLKYFDSSLGFGKFKQTAIDLQIF
jgi:hypothetical protein